MSKSSHEGPTGRAERGRDVTRIETFVDAAFAFAVTLLVVMVDSVPNSVTELREAFKAVPAFAASFALISMFWFAHHRWSRRYGLDDTTTVLLSLLLVFLVLVYVYPLRMLAASMFHWLSGGHLAAGFVLQGPQDMLDIYVAYGFGFASLSTVIFLMHRHAWALRERLALGVDQRIAVRVDMMAMAMTAATGLLSAALALALPPSRSPWVLAMPGLCYNVLLLLPFLAHFYARRLARSSGLPRPSAFSPEQ